MSSLEMEKLLKTIELDLDAGVVRLPIPSDKDAQIIAVISYFLGLNENDRAFFIKEVNTIRLWNILSGFSVRMAILGVREYSIERIFHGLIAHVIEDFRYDWREGLIDLSLLNHSAEKIAADPVALFERAADSASTQTAQVLRDFAQRSPSSKSIKAFSHREVLAKDGFRYEYIKPSFQRRMK